MEDYFKEYAKKVSSYVIDEIEYYWKENKDAFTPKDKVIFLKTIMQFCESLLKGKDNG